MWSLKTGGLVADSITIECVTSTLNKTAVDVSQHLAQVKTALT